MDIKPEVIMGIQDTIIEPSLTQMADLKRFISAGKVVIHVGIISERYYMDVLPDTLSGHYDTHYFIIKPKA